jgi:alkylresorcinol/alkylpyrone synthase
MSYIQCISKALPNHLLDQEAVRDLGRRVLKGKVPFLEQALGLFNNAGVDCRYLVRNVHEILDNDDLGWRNQIYRDESLALCERLMADLLEQSGIAATDVDMIITTSCTGFMIPSVDAYLINKFGLRQDVKRLPITELGCAAGAMALSRAHDYLLAYPDHKVVVLAVELPSLTYRTKDFRVANLVSAALFGDGAAGVLLSGEPSQVSIRGTRTHFFYDTLDMMGFDLSASGFKIILNKRIAPLVKDHFGEPLQAFLEANDLGRDDVKNWVFHPGGRRILDNLRDLLELDETDVAASRKVLREVGNLSSASVLWVLAERLEQAQKGPGLMAAFGPGFNAEMLLLDFHGN